jgi:hypothetical protein
VKRVTKELQVGGQRTLRFITVDEPPNQTRRSVLLATIATGILADSATSQLFGSPLAFDRDRLLLRRVGDEAALQRARRS